MKPIPSLPILLLVSSAAACAGTPEPAAPAAGVHVHGQAAPAAHGGATPHDAAPAAPAAAESKDPFANAACPVMAKPSSRKLYADTVHGRLYICCKGCEEEIAEDVEAAYKAAYPHVQTHANTVCPVTGKAVDEKSVAVSIQGHAFRVADAEAAKTAAADAIKVLGRLMAAEKGEK